MDIIDTLKLARLQKGLTQEQLGERAGLKPKYYNEIERRRQSPNYTTLAKLAAVLGCEVTLKPKAESEVKP